MTLQVLVATMHQTDHSLLEKMNIQSDAIVVNQCNRNEVERFMYNGHQILWMSLNERGIGLSRNTLITILFVPAARLLWPRTCKPRWTQ